MIRQLPCSCKKRMHQPLLWTRAVQISTAAAAPPPLANRRSRSDLPLVARIREARESRPKKEEKEVRKKGGRKCDELPRTHTHAQPPNPFRSRLQPLLWGGGGREEGNPGGRKPSFEDGAIILAFAHDISSRKQVQLVKQ